MAVPTAVPDVQYVAALTRRESESLAGVLEGLTAEQWRLPACGDWTVDQVSGHLGIVPSSVQQWYDAAIEGEEVEPLDMRDPEFQETQLDMIGEADPEDRVAGVRYAYGAAADYVDELGAASLDLPTYTPEGMLPLSLAVRISLSELFVHGFDIRRAAGLDDRGDQEVAAAVLPHAAAVLPSFLAGARDLVAPVELVAGDQSWTLAPSTGGVAVTDGGQGARSTLRLDPGELVLLVWGRITLADALARGGRIDGDAASLESLFAQLDPL
ncbi:MAG: maleylpyruvate isomerase family mycothiol-dependent enzyme [Chloroflexi bacterium]|nr:MAG: maleylpyruvate isomerase family mycothiol-dependent enzyme [Chloroflexota bacterium]